MLKCMCDSVLKMMFLASVFQRYSLNKYIDKHTDSAEIIVSRIRGVIKKTQVFGVVCLNVRPNF